MATIEQLEKQKQNLITGLNQILNDPKIPVNDKMPVIKELSRAIASLAEQINKLTPTSEKVQRTQTIPKAIAKETKKSLASPKDSEEARKEEIKQVRKEKKELQATQIPEKAEEGKWRMEDVIKVVKLDLSKIDYIKAVQNWGTFIDWDRFWDQAKPMIINEIKEKMEASGFKFPIVLQTSMKVVNIVLKKGLPPEPRYRGCRTDSISNIKYIANNEEQLKSVLELQFMEVRERTKMDGEGSDEQENDIVSYHVRFWEYRPSVIRRAATIFAKGNGYIEVPTWLQNRRAIINIKNTDNQCFIKCLYRAINYDSKNRNNNRDVDAKELEAFRKQFNCSAIGEEYVDIGKFEDDNPSISVDIYHIPLRKKDKVSIIYRSKNTDPKHKVNLGYLEDDEGGTHYVIITKLHLLFKDKYTVKNGEKICFWCKAVYRNDHSDDFEKHLIECRERISYVHTDFWSRIKLPK
jgi:hypothetical protein